MNMQVSVRDPTGKLVDSCGRNLATAVHELVHQLGLQHEQQRPETASTVKFHCENYWDPDCPEATCCRTGNPPTFPLKDNGKGECCRGVEQFEPVGPTPDDLLGKPYDIHSIVQYPYWASSKKGRPTLTVLRDNSPVPDNMGEISKGDIETLCIL